MTISARGVWPFVKHHIPGALYGNASWVANTMLLLLPLFSWPLAPKSNQAMHFQQFQLCLPGSSKWVTIQLVAASMLSPFE